MNLHAAVGVHALVAAQVRELGVCLEADLALERLHRGVDVRVLLQAGRSGERFAALGTRVTPGPNVVGANVSLEVRGIRKDLRMNGRGGAGGGLVAFSRSEWDDLFGYYRGW